MDWSKAKKILIIALLITNLVLFGFLVSNYLKNQDKTTSTKFIKETVQLLKEKDITIGENVYIPKNKNKLPSLKVEFESYLPSEINKNFFNSLGTLSNPTSDYSQISYGNELVSIFNSRRIWYENLNEDGHFNIKNIVEAEELVNDFLIQHKFNTNNMERTYRKEEDGKYYINYSKTYEDIIVERSFTRFVVDKNIGIVSMDRLWLEVVEKSQLEMSIGSAPKALLSLLDEAEYYGKTIVDIDECFFFDPEVQGYVEDITKASQGRAVPAWRIQFDDGDNIEVDNF